MRIGLLTLPLHSNYGGILQAYALQTVLEKMGHEVRVFNRDYISGTNIVMWKYPLLLGKRLVYKLLIDNRAPILMERKRKEETPVIYQHTNRFINTYIHTYKVDHLSEIPSDVFDCIIVGSDQVWRPDYFKKMWKTGIQDAFLKFTKGWNIRRVTYAASFGIDEWVFNPSVTKECKELIKMFDEVSVREESAVQLCLEHLGCVPEHVLDPTMLLTARDYIELIDKVTVSKSTGILFNYILDETEDKRRLVNLIAKDRGLVPFRMNNNSQDRFATMGDRIIPSVEEWLRGFCDAEFVITDSFHGCVFSIIFVIPFVTVGNVGRGLSRFKSLLKMFNLESHFLTSLNDYSSLSRYSIPDNLNEELVIYQKKSFDYLKRSLSYQ